MHPTKKILSKLYKTEPSTLDGVANCIIKIENSKPEPRLTGFSWDVSWRDSVSNSHSSPLNGVQNWRGEEGIPRGYPGFYGRVWVKYEKEYQGFDRMRNVLAHTGTGGSGFYDGPWNTKDKGYCLSWDFKIFVDDWPLLKEEINKEKTLLKLQGKDFSLTHRFLWNG